MSNQGPSVVPVGSAESALRRHTTPICHYTAGDGLLGPCGSHASEVTEKPEAKEEAKRSEVSLAQRSRCLFFCRCSGHATF